MVYLLRRGAQKDIAKPEDGFKNETICKAITHNLNYTNKKNECNQNYSIVYFHRVYFRATVVKKLKIKNLSKVDISHKKDKI